jgi:hypothetical protein
MRQPSPTPSSEKREKRRRMWKRVGRDVLTIVMLLAAIGYTASLIRPIYAGRAPVVGQMIQKAAPESAPPAIPPLPPMTGAFADSVAAIEASPDFQDQKRRFTADLVRTGRLSQERADSIAHFAVREAFLRGIPPAVIFGVMLTENAQFISRARSNVGAVGLMQVYPKYWLKDLSKKFGASDIESDSTNMRYGVFILEHYLKPRGKKRSVDGPGHIVATAPGSLMKGLLRYNGCVRGTNTPRCHTYPSKVQKFVERDAEALCGNRDFYSCIAQPFMSGLLGRAGGD